MVSTEETRYRFGMEEARGRHLSVKGVVVLETGDLGMDVGNRNVKV